jgi:hypothetical protein
MTAKEKSRELVDNFIGTQRGFVMPIIIAKQCALIAVDEILNANQIWYADSVPSKYWQEVKAEIENI